METVISRDGKDKQVEMLTKLRAHKEKHMTSPHLRTRPYAIFFYC